MKKFGALEAAVTFYQKALEALEENPTQTELLRVTIARSEVQRILRAGERVSAGMVEQLAALDRRLEKQRTRIFVAEGLYKLNYWRQIIQPTQAEWWWHGQPPMGQSWWEKLDWFWAGLTLVLLTISLSLTADAAARFLSGGLDALSVLTIAVPSILAMLTSGTLTKVGKDARQYLFTRWQIEPRRWEVVTLAFTFLLFLSLVGFHQSYSFMAVWFNNRGVSHYEANRLGSALSDYQRAIALQPNYAQAHYHLGLLYEDLQKLKEAKAEYQLAVENGADAPASLPMLKARNNLGRLHLLEKKYALAMPPLLEVENAINEEQVKANEDYKKLKYTALKNLGWAQLGEGHTKVAGSLLQEAIQLFEKKAAIYCLRAQVYEKQKQLKLALKDWERCLSMESNFKTNSEEYRWQTIAREKLAAPNKTP